jgi:geranylgeranyl diphosphate synthase type II
MTFADYLDARRKDVEAALEGFLSKAPAVPPVLVEAMRYSLLGGGKRLRPLLVMASAEGVAQAVGASEAAARDAALPAACAIEMIHTYSLIHDDLPSMDDDACGAGGRRHTSCMARGWRFSRRWLAGRSLPPARARAAGSSPDADDAEAEGDVDHRGCGRSAGMVGGQAIDLDAIKPPFAKATGGTPAAELTPEGLRDMHARKTGALIRASVTAGAVMGGATESLFALLDRYGTEIGLAFQIVDDILDEEGWPRLARQDRRAKDKAAGKPTYPAFFGLDRSKALAAECNAKARAALEKAGLLDSRLADIAGWIIERKT